MYIGGFRSPDSKQQANNYPHHCKLELPVTVPLGDKCQSFAETQVYHNTFYHFTF